MSCGSESLTEAGEGYDHFWLDRQGLPEILDCSSIVALSLCGNSSGQKLIRINRGFLLWGLCHRNLEAQSQKQKEDGSHDNQDNRQFRWQLSERKPRFAGCRKESKRNEFRRAKTALRRSTDNLNYQVPTILTDLSFGVTLIRDMLDRQLRMFQIDQT
jgi:hypothetical protein